MLKCLLPCSSKHSNLVARQIEALKVFQLAQSFRDHSDQVISAVKASRINENRVVEFPYFHVAKYTYTDSQILNVRSVLPAQRHVWSRVEPYLIQIERVGRRSEQALTAQIALHVDNAPQPKLAQVGHSTQAFRNMALERVRGQVERLITTIWRMKGGLLSSSDIPFGRRGLRCGSQRRPTAWAFFSWGPPNELFFVSVPHFVFVRRF